MVPPLMANLKQGKRAKPRLGSSQTDVAINAGSRGNVTAAR